MKKLLKMQCIGNQQLQQQQQQQQQQQHSLHTIFVDKIKTKISTSNNYVNGAAIGQQRHQQHQNNQHSHQMQQQQKFSNKKNLIDNKEINAVDSDESVLIKNDEDNDIVAASQIDLYDDKDVGDDGSDNKLQIDLDDERSQITQQKYLPKVIITKANNCTSGGVNGSCLPLQFTQQQQQQVRVIKDGRLYESECRSYIDQGIITTTTVAKTSPTTHSSMLPPQNQVNVIASGVTLGPIKTNNDVSKEVASVGNVVTPTNTTNATTTTIFRPPVVSSTSAATMRPPPPPPPLTKLRTVPPEEPSSSIPDLEFDGTTVLCRVCGDKASGFHYGVHSCEGCKGFFRRSIQQKIQYRPCTKNQQCSILRINRNRCQYCRLKKCIAVGMSRDAVRFGRVPKREKARILAAMQQSTQNRGQQRLLATELDDQPRLLAAVLRAHMETCEFTKDKVQAMRHRARDCPSYSMPTLACPLNPAPELQSEQEFSQRFAHVIRGVIDFAGMIPGFQLLTQDDKFTLLKAGLFDALFVRLICMFDSSINSIICLNGQVMRRDSIQNGANARFLVDSTFNFAERINYMALTDAEIGLFCAIVLITPDRPGLRNIELIEKMYNKLKQCLQTIITQNRPDQPEFMHELLKTMPDLRTLSTLHTEKLVVFRTEHKELLRQQMWSSCDEEGSSVAGKSPAGSSSSWGCDIGSMEDVAKSPMGSVSSTESGDTSVSSEYSHQSSLTSSAPLLAATLAGGVVGGCPMRLRANSSGSSTEDDMMLGHLGSQNHCVSASTTVAATARLVAQNGLTITPVVRQISPPTNNVVVGATTATSSTSPAGVTINQQQHNTHHIRYRKLDSPTDSGIESGNEKNDRDKNASSGGSSSCSSPRSSVEDATEEKRHIVEDMPVLKRVLQAPPLYDTNSLMDEAYKPHKKFRAMRHRESEAEAAESSTSSTSITPISIQTSSLATSTITSAIQPHTSQLHMHLTRPTNVTNAGQNHSTAHLQQQQQLHNSMQQQLHLQQKHHQCQSASSSPNNILHHHLTAPPTTYITITPPHNQQQQQQSTLSSTHSVLAKSLMEEPRMTPEQMKRSDIIQNYIMRESAAEQHHHQQQQHKNGLLVVAGINAGSTTITPANGGSSSAAQCPFASSSVAARWHTPSVITTTGRQQQTPSPSSSEQSSSRYFQSPHSTSSSVSLPGPSPSSSSSGSSIGLIASPSLNELQVDVADTQQPLNLSKKSPSPIPIVHRVGTTTTIVHPHQQAAIVPVEIANGTIVQQQQQQQEDEEEEELQHKQQQPGPSATASVVHKVLLEA